MPVIDSCGGDNFWGNRQAWPQRHAAQRCMGVRYLPGFSTSNYGSRESPGAKDDEGTLRIDK